MSVNTGNRKLDIAIIVFILLLNVLWVISLFFRREDNF